MDASTLARFDYLRTDAAMKRADALVRSSPQTTLKLARALRQKRAQQTVSARLRRSQVRAVRRRLHF